MWKINAKLATHYTMRTLPQFDVFIKRKKSVNRKCQQVELLYIIVLLVYFNHVQFVTREDDRGFEAESFLYESITCV